MTIILTFWALLSALAVGSFLNVVIYRGPIIWGLVERPENLPPHFSLAWPRSHCPSCAHPIRLTHLIPLLGFVLAKGHCGQCGVKISPQYPLIESLTLLGAVIALSLWGFSLGGLAAFVFFCLLICLLAIDAKIYYLPDALTWPLIASGLLVNIFGFMQSWQSALLGAVVGYGLFWALGLAYRLVRKRDGLGHGDAKLLAGLGAWCGALYLPVIIFVAAFSALGTIFLWRLMGHKITAQTPLPFGPFLSLAGAIILISQKLSDASLYTIQLTALSGALVH